MSRISGYRGKYLVLAVPAGEAGTELWKLPHALQVSDQEWACELSCAINAAASFGGQERHALHKRGDSQFPKRASRSLNSVAGRRSSSRESHSGHCSTQSPAYSTSLRGITVSCQRQPGQCRTKGRIGTGIPQSPLYKYPLACFASTTGCVAPGNGWRSRLGARPWPGGRSRTPDPSPCSLARRPVALHGR